MVCSMHLKHRDEIVSARMHGKDQFVFEETSSQANTAKLLYIDCIYAKLLLNEAQTAAIIKPSF